MAAPAEVSEKHSNFRIRQFKEKRYFNIGANLMLSMMISFIVLLIARTARIACADRQTHTHTHIQDNYCNPHCALHSTLLTHIFQLGVNGKCWRILKNWYSNAFSVVKVNHTHSDYFPVNRGVKQGSVLSPTLFIAVMDSLLSHLESSGLGLSVSGLSVGSSAHVDDIRAASVGIDAVRTQRNLVVHFCKANSLKLNATKTELVKFSQKKPDPISHVIYSWSGNSSTSKCKMSRNLVAIQSLSNYIHPLKNVSIKQSVLSLP